MNQDLMPFLEASFKGLSQQIDQQIAGLREEMNQRFEQMDRRFEQVDRRFEQVDRRFEQVDQRFEQVDQRFEGVETTARHTLVLVENLRTDLQLVAEAMIGYQAIQQRHRSEVGAELSEIRRLIEPSYKGLDGRVRALEVWVEGQYGGALEAIRKTVLQQRQRDAG